MSDFERGDTVVIVRRHKNGQKFDEGKIVSIGSKWITVEHLLGGRTITDRFRTDNHCLENFGDVAKVTSLTEWAVEAEALNLISY